MSQRVEKGFELFRKLFFYKAFQHSYPNKGDQ
ncbi:MAG TPA: hypothetical protein DEB17_10800 [Chlorobaculum sp.]|uniref:Uncharacterized protein n=1 Tax=Chlorobaculum tepidum (strain ATCC 49652 / DSM 12025 / NBRC 103806 / TLS) TaxID=194439 RepID=Q8KBJ8_CHLTE|nr:hypothetical protein CT1789 [Chlorobaculum tepidum TLS]HBU24456.1 hypothetical protein [Chlorobaculum sp.]